ncbi:MAG: helix-turn-helix transcriptional regulator [Bacteroides sp.]|nr:helix-turn-helix transcriptional regulator [Bacteroides sp.]
MSDFRLIAPSPLLAPYVKHYWVLHTRPGAGFTERVTPTGIMQLFFYSGGAIHTRQKSWQGTSLLSGHTTDYVDLHGNEQVRILSVVFQPWGARAFFRFPLDEVAGQHATAEDLSDTQFRELEKRVIGQPDEKACIRLIEEFLTQRFQLERAYNYQRMTEAIRLIDRTGGEISLTALSDVTCLSQKQFQRVFTDHIGIRPKEFLRIVRFQYTLSRMKVPMNKDFTRLACECGYYDQSHLIREFRQFSGYTPKEYIQACDPYSDYFQS